ncbi:MAG: P-loop NTPase fold protein [Bacteroidota bacterium]
MDYRKAIKLEEVDNAVRFDVPIGPKHPFFTDFSEVRGDFEEKMIYRSLNVNPKTFEYNRVINKTNKTLLFLAGMRGSGKTSELKKIAEKLHHRKAFFCVFCNLDDGLDLNDMEYMDILIFQLERLVEELKENQLKIDNKIIESFQDWYAEQIKEINKAIKREGGFEIELEGKKPSLLTFLGISAKLKGNLAGSKENATKIRTVLKKNFTAFSQKFNEFVATINKALRDQDKAEELLFIVDGLEKVATIDIRKKIVDDESNRIRQIKVNTIFTLPIELFALEPKLRQFSTVVSFPFVKLVGRTGERLEEPIKRFEDFVLRRIDENLFDSPETIKDAICYGGGSPRELLRVLEYTYLHSEVDAGQLTKAALEKAVKKLSAEYARYLTGEDLKQLKLLKENNEKGLGTPFDESWQDLLEKLIVLEYNDGTYRRVHPLVEASQLYQQYVGD